MALISSSVIPESEGFLMLKILNIKFEITDNSQTNGFRREETKCMVLAVLLAIFSAFSMANFLGINSPNITERNVTIITTIVVAIVSAYSFRGSNCSINGFNSSPNFSPEYTPVRIAISVKPICAVLKYLSGWSIKFKAFFAFSSPLLASDSILERLALINAISLTTISAFTKISKINMSISMFLYK